MVPGKKRWTRTSAIDCSPVTLLLVALVLAGCSKIPEAQWVVNRSIEAHGGPRYNGVFITFDFRDRQYTITKQNGLFEYTRSFSDSIGTVRDVLHNGGFQRYINNLPVELTEKEEARYANSVNSVAYFFLLPVPLNDPAAQKSLLEDELINDTAYYRVQVSFLEEGGGEDYSDEFVFWINKETFTMDYMAYSYESGSGGYRFRAAKNRRRISGILVDDYDNFKPPENHEELRDFARLYTLGALEKVSEIANNNVQVTVL